MKNEGFPKTLVVKKEFEFKRILEHGARRGGASLVVFRLRADHHEGQKFGIKVARGIKKAASRNRLKRMIREFLRRNKDRFGRDEQVVVLCRSAAAEKDVRELKAEMVSLIR
ncbi:MAG: ribonuclease P protein component [Candidatus Zixiibacteriota bacterium]